MRGRNPTEDMDRAEAAALYTEYAIDFATQSTRRALAALLLLGAAEEQKNSDKDKEKRSKAL